MKTTVENITHKQISALGDQAAAAGDLLMHAICQLALGIDDYSDAAWLNNNTRLDPGQRRQLQAMTVESAIVDCVRAINDAEGQKDDS